MSTHSYHSTLLTTREAARRLGLSPGTLQNWRVRGVGPVFIRLKGKSTRGRGAIRYSEVDLDHFVTQSRAANSIN
jgi:hypothetical protein